MDASVDASPHQLEGLEPSVDDVERLLGTDGEERLVDCSSHSRLVKSPEAAST